MSNFTKTSFEGSLLSSIVYNDEIGPESEDNQIFNALNNEWTDVEIQYFLDNFEIISTADFDESLSSIPEYADSGYQGMLVKRKGSDEGGEAGEFWFVNRGTEVTPSDP